MTKKDYIALARIIKELRKGVAHEKPLNGVDGMRTIILNGVINKLTNYCELDNPRFDKDTFIKATQLTEEEMRLPL
mgnify:FL=1|tara:strand:+ start:543 stop:770 length:228 start_codon:yes stop_codon:yes gene_type:complete